MVAVRSSETYQAALVIQKNTIMLFTAENKSKHIPLFFFGKE
jgi:hypothetical protein